MIRREFIKTMSVALAAGATMKTAYVQTAEQDVRYDKACHCGECEHLVHVGCFSNQGNEAYLDNDCKCAPFYDYSHWCDHKKKYLNKGNPHKMLACRHGIKLQKDKNERR